ncbi:flagellar hook-basal body complex protein FliE [Treponema pectinovorum]|uniref:flagellar hook-basal body complex protein FliE n=1 Tax=Treponema pectinovorum TaxID=164 RepID=UPI0021C2FCB7|nr:flagellar hook-basal body complex protein FliE [Treponema pectinovorum]
MNAMQIMASPVMTRTNSAHSGTAPLTKMIPGQEQIGDTNKKPGIFESYLLEAVNHVNENQLEVGKLQEKLITDPNSVDIHDVTTAMAKAQMSLTLAQTVIERLVSGWSEIQTAR